MKNSSVTINGLTRTQANIIAILFEDADDIVNLVNKKLEKMELEEENLDYFTVEFDDSDGSVHHEVFI